MEIDPFVFRLAIFILYFVGYYVVWSVTPALHTPLMSVTNAISSVIIVGALVAVAVSGSDSSIISFYSGIAGILLAAINIFGGFFVTMRMLKMYKKGKKINDFSKYCCITLSCIRNFFILALRGLSSPETSRTGNIFGMSGMTIAIITTLLSIGSLAELMSNISFILIPLLIGGVIGGLIAARIAMTAMPQLVAGFHSLVGLCAVLIAIAAYYDPQAFGIFENGKIKLASLIEMSIGSSIGAITFFWFLYCIFKTSRNYVWLSNCF